MSVEDKLIENGYEGSVYLTNPDYEDAVIGVSSDGQVVYDYGKMVECLMDEEGMTEDEACEWIDYNVIRGLPYISDSSISFD